MIGCHSLESRYDNKTQQQVYDFEGQFLLHILTEWDSNQDFFRFCQGAVATKPPPWLLEIEKNIALTLYIFYSVEPSCKFFVQDFYEGSTEQKDKAYVCPLKSR